MTEGEVLTGFRVYKDHTHRKSYYRDHLRRTRDMQVVEARFPNETKTYINKINKNLFKNLTSLQKISDSFFQRVKLDAEVLEGFKNLMGQSFENGNINFETFLSSDKPNIILLFELMFKTLSQNYDRILDLENQVQSLTDKNTNLNSYVSEVLDEHERLRKFAADCEEMRTSEVGKVSEEYQMLYEDYSTLQEQLIEANQKIYYLEEQQYKNTNQNIEENPVLLDAFHVPYDNMSLFNPQVDDNQLLEYERKINELKKSNDLLFEENMKLSKNTREEFGADKFVTLSLLFHQITKTFNKLFQDQHDLDRIAREDQILQKLNSHLLDSRLNVLEYENRVYKERLVEVEELLKDETVERVSLQSFVSELKTNLYQTESVLLDLEDMKEKLIVKENELKQVKESGEVSLEQLSKMQHMVTNLTYEKNELLKKVAELEFTRDSLMKESDVMREQMNRLENLVSDQLSDKFDFREKITNIQLQADIKILEDKLTRFKVQHNETKLENYNLVSSMVEMRNSLERERRENSELLKRISISVKNESKMTVEMQQLSNEVNALKASIETSTVNLRGMANELGLVNRKIFEKDLQLSSVEAKKDELKSLLDDFSTKLNMSKVSKANVNELKKLDLKSVNYSELIQFLTPSGLTSSTTDKNYATLITSLDNLVSYNELLVNLCMNLARELNTLSANVLNVTNFSNIFETFNIDLVNVDVLKNENMVKLSDLKAKLKNQENLNKELAAKHVWEKSVVRVIEKYEKTVSHDKKVFKECDDLIKLNQKSLDSLIYDNKRLRSDCSNGAVTMLGYEKQISDLSLELVQLKELIFTLLPTQFKFSSSKETPLKSIELLNNYINNIPPNYNNVSNVLSMSRTSNAYDPPKQPKLEPVKLVKEEVVRAEKETFVSTESSKELSDDKDQLLSSKERQLNDVYEDINYYCNLIVSDIKSQLSADQCLDTDYENSTHDVFSDDTVSDYKDEDYVVEKFEEILNLLNKLFYHYTQNGVASQRNYTKFDDTSPPNLVLDMSIIRCISKFVHTLKRYYTTFKNQDSFVLDDLEYQFESIPTILDRTAKFKAFCSNLTKLLNLSTDFILDQLNENSEQMNQLMKNFESTNASLQQLEHSNTVKDQQLKSSLYEINELKLQIGHLESLYQREKNNNRENKLNMENCEYELKKIRDELRDQVQKNDKLLLLVNEYQQIIELQKSRS